MSDRGSYFVRRQLGRQLRDLRQSAGKSAGDVASAKIVSEGKLSRIENGQNRITIGDALALCRFYGVDAETTDGIAAMAPATLQADWWEQYGNLVVPAWFGLYLSLEAEAHRIRAYDQDVIHGLLQTEDYARAVVHAGLAESDGARASQSVAFRMRRQRVVFDRHPAPQVRVVLGAGALQRVVGGRDVLDAQLAHLAAIARGGTADIRVLPWESGAYPLRGPYSMFDFPDPDDPPVAHVEVPAGARYLEKPEELALYEQAWAALEERSVPIEEYLT